MADYFQGDITYGNTATAGNASMRAKVTYRIVAETATQCNVWVHESIEILANSFQNTTMNITTNHGNTLSSGNIGSLVVNSEDLNITQGAPDSSAQYYYRDLGWIDRGTTVYLLAQASYYGTSGTYYHTNANSSFTVPTNWVLSAPCYVWQYDATGTPRKVTEMYFYV